MASSYCPDCDGEIVMSPQAKLGQKVTCPHCDAELEVIALDPLEFDWVYDWSWDEEEEEEEDE